MTLPATNVTLGAVNTELGNAGTATVTLNNIRVRSLGSNLSASGTAFSMSGLASKSSTWGLGKNVASGYSYLARALIPAIDQNCFYIFFWFGFADQVQIEKQYINGNFISASAIVDPLASSAYSYGSGVGPFSTSNLYSVLSSYSGSYYAFAKISPAGTLLQAIRLKGPTNSYSQYANEYSSVVVDALDNAYSTPLAQSSAGASTSSYSLVSVNSSLAVRWSRAFPPLNAVSSSTPIYSVGQLSIDSSGNVYLTYGSYTPSIPYSYVGFVKFDSSGTELLNRAFTFTTSPTTLPFVRSRAGIGASGEVVVLSEVTNPQATAYTTYYNNAGTIQWSLTVTYADSGFQGVRSRDCVMDSANNTYALYWCGSDIFNYPRIWLVKFNSSGTLQWQRCFTNLNIVNVNSLESSRIALSLTGNDTRISVFLFGGFYDDYTQTGSPALFTVKTDGSGTGVYVLNDYTTLSYQTTPVLTFVTNTPTVVTGVSPSATTYTAEADTTYVATPPGEIPQILINI
jgi:hypothetical protein